MTQSSALLVTLELAERRRTVSLDELEQALSNRPLEQALLELVHNEAHPQPIPRRRGTIGGGGSRNPGNERKRSSENRFRTFVQEERNLQAREERTAPLVDNSPEALASLLADRLHDWKSHAFYRQLARSLPEPVIRDLLTRALDVPERDIRRSRGALFTTLARKALAEGKTQPSPSNSSQPT